MSRTLVFLAILAMSTGAALATPSTLVWIPSTDTQARGSWHLGIDNSFGLGNGASLPTDVGLTYGLTPRLELGVDVLGSTDDPVFLNGKVSLLRSARTDVAAGVYNLGTSADTNAHLVYAVASHRCGAVRLTAGVYTGDRQALGGDRSGLLLGLDGATKHGTWLGADYQGGDNAVGALSVGAARALKEGISLLVGWQHFTATDDDMMTTQLDVDF